MVSINDIHNSLNSMILSASGWRGVFAVDGDEESKTGEISEAHRIIAAGTATVFADFLKSRGNNCTPLVLTGSDTRPTGRAISEAIICSLLGSGCEVKWAGSVAAPEIMAWAQAVGAAESSKRPVGFIYISASHNPIGHNGIKFGLVDGGVLAPEKASALIADFKSLMDDPERVSHIEQTLESADGLEAVYAGEAAALAVAKREALDAYSACINRVAWQSAAEPSETLAAVKNGLAHKPLGLVCDFNGSARSVSIDRQFFTSLGIAFNAINEKPGGIAHRIVPEGESLEPCMRFLEEMHCKDASFVLGYTPDCDGDRGNLVIWDESLKRARILEAQEVFALACVAELSQLVWAGELAYDSNGSAVTRAAVAVNDSTSLRIDRIAAAFDVSLFRAETGEANVVGLARRLREDGYLVRILGEGSAGGTITHPQAVRDPLNTVLALVKMLAIRSETGRPGLFEIWCGRSHQNALYRDDFTLADIIASLPPFVTTGAYEDRAKLTVHTTDHGLLKDRYQQIFLRDWDRRRENLGTRYGIYNWEAAAYNGIEEKRRLNRFGDAGRGGLKIYFSGSDGKIIASLWMRGSATEPVFRVMADVEGRDTQAEQEFIEWQRRMVCEADSNH